MSTNAFAKTVYEYKLIAVILTAIVLATVSYVWKFENVRVDVSAQSLRCIGDDGYITSLEERYRYKRYLFLNTDKEENKLRDAAACVKEVNIDKEFPSTLHIAVETYTPVLVVATPRKTVLLSKEGILLRVVGANENKDENSENENGNSKSKDGNYENKDENYENKNGNSKNKDGNYENRDENYENKDENLTNKEATPGNKGGSSGKNITKLVEAFAVPVLFTKKDIGDYQIGQTVDSVPIETIVKSINVVNFLEPGHRVVTIDEIGPVLKLRTDNSHVYIISTDTDIDLQLKRMILVIGEARREGLDYKEADFRYERPILR